MNHYAWLVILLFTTGGFQQDQLKHIGEIEFFGYSGINLNQVKAALPFQEGGEFNFEKGEETINQAREAVRQITGQAPTDISVGCCDSQGNWIIWIGLSRKPGHYNPQPKGNARLPVQSLHMYERFTDALMKAVEKGAAAEDRSKGYALSVDPALHAIQLEMRAYAVGHGALLHHILKNAADDQQRIVATELLGYGRQSKSQLIALTYASRDRNSTVRNNATRALLVLAESNPKIAAEIPVESFVELLLSGTWTDLNKASLLLSSVMRNSSTSVPAALHRKEVIERLIEIARWRTGHAEPARYILGRIAGIDETSLEQLIRSEKVEEIINRLHRK